MTRYALILLLPFALGCGGGDDASTNYSTAGEVPGVDSPSMNLTGTDCLAGTWEMDIASSYNMDSVNEMMAQEGAGEFQMEFAGSDGHIYMTLNRDGSAEATHDNAVITINADSPMGEMTITNTMNGTAAGNYAVAGDTLKFTGGGESNMTTDTQVMMGGRPMSNSSSDNDSVFESSEGSAMIFECTGDVLLIDVHDTTGESRLVFDDMRFTRSGGPA